MLGRITVGLFFMLLIWGNLVAGMKAGLACPDWPLCQGELLPPFRLDIWMEFSHRLLAAAATVSLLALAHFRFRSYQGWAKAIPLAAVGLVVVEILLGGLTVLLELPVQLTTLHFMSGLAVFLLAFYMLEFDGNSRLPRFSLHGFAPLFIGMIALVFSQAALGAYVRHAQAGLACPDFPACQGGWLPPSLTGPVFLHYSHRLAGYGIALTAMALCGAAFLDRGLGRYRGKALLLVILSLAQIGAGAFVVLSGLNFAAAAVHLAIALAILSLLFHLWVAELCKREGALSKAG